MNSTPVQIGPYRLAAEIGHGEIGIVYRATDTLYERTVALKVMRSHVAQDLVMARQFVSSGREAMRLRHPNILRVHDAGQADGLYYVAMDLAQALTLKSRLAQTQGPWESSSALRIVEQVGGALEYAHRRGLVHLNLRPDNIFVGDESNVAVADFDCIAAPAGVSGHPLYYRLKSPLYLAPEQARGDDQIDASADIYSLAAIAYRLLTGRPPVDGGNPLNLLWRIAEEVPARADEIVPTISTTVADALAAALAKDPKQRLGQVSELVRGLGGAPLPPRSAKSSATRESVKSPKNAAEVDRPQVIAPLIIAAATAEPNSASQPIKNSTTIPYEPPPPPAASQAASPAAEELDSSAPLLPIASLWKRATGTARKAEPMAFPALALLAVAGLAALLLIFAAMRVAGTLIARITDDNSHNAGQIIVILPTVTPTRVALAEGASVQRVGEKLGTEQGVEGDGGDIAVEPGDRNGAELPMAVVVTSTVTSAPSPTPMATLAGTDTPQPPKDTPVATSTPTPSPTPTATETPTATPSPTDTATPIPTETPTVTPTPSPTPAPTAEAMAGRLAFTLWNPHTDRPDIWVWDLARRVSNTPLTNYRQPDFSANGVLVANAYGGGGVDNLVTMGLYGEGMQLISAHSEDSHPHWSPDGKKVVFDSALMGDRQYRLYLQDDLTQHNDRPPMMYAGFEIFGRYPIFLADGRIAYNGCNYWQNGSICGIYVLSIDGAQPVNATGWPGDVPTDNIGTRILFMSDREGSWDIYSMNPDGSDLEQLTKLPGVEGLATASPDGSMIAYLSNQDGVWSFFVMAADGSNIRKLMDLPGNYGRGENDWFQERISWGR